MSAKKKSSKNMVEKKNKSKVLSCSTPEHRAHRTSRDSDLICDTESTSPVPFFCTQDGTEGETDVVWNFYTPKSEHASASRLKNLTPLSRHEKKIEKSKITQKPIPKRRALRSSHKNNELLQELVELNQNVHQLLGNKLKNNNQKDKQQFESEENVFISSPEVSPKTVKTNSRCLRKNVLSSKFNKPETEALLESDDSMNEYLLKASQVVEECILKDEDTPAKKACYEYSDMEQIPLKKDDKYEIGQDSMDSILKNIRIQTPVVTSVKKCDTPHLKNDSFDSLVGNLNDSALERLTQIPVKNETTIKNIINNKVHWSDQEFVLDVGSPSSKCVLNRHNSMPESPSVANLNKESTNGMAFGRYKSMPYQNNTALDGSPIRCTPEEIKRKHQQAREKLLAKRLLPFTSTQQSSQCSGLSTQQTQQNKPSKKTQFQPRTASSSANINICNKLSINSTESLNIKQSKSTTNMNTTDLKLLIEKKRQEALMRLRRRQPKKVL